MSALARYFNAQGKHVSGYDKTKTTLTSQLEDEGVTINFKDDSSLIPSEVLGDREHSLIIYTPAIPKNHQQFEFLKNRDFNILKRAQLLGQISKEKFTMAVAGTHGKTTTTAILGHLLKETGAKVTAFLGGISEDINSNLIMQGDEVIVLEADEFDRSFLNIHPNYAAVTSVDADHLDIYGKKEELEKSFSEFVSQVSEDGKLFLKNGLPFKGLSIGIEDSSDYSAQNIKIENGTYVFDLVTPANTLEKLEFNLPGRHNLTNAVTDLAMTIEYGSPTGHLARALSSFQGVKRRFNYKIKTEQVVLIDDYAHHPTEINAVHQAVREMYPNKKVLAVFQPHLFSRTRDFAEDFATSLSQFDAVFLLDIYPARELPIEGISSAWLLDLISNPDKKLVSKQDLSSEMKEKNYEINVMIGAGDIGEEVESVRKVLEV